MAHHVVQVDVGSSPDELLDDLQAALLRRQHERSLTVLYANTKTRMNNQYYRIKNKYQCWEQLTEQHIPKIITNPKLVQSVA